MSDNNELIESYGLNAYGVEAVANIKRIKGANVPLYELILPEIKPGTEAVLESIGRRLKDIRADYSGASSAEMEKQTNAVIGRIGSMIKETLPELPENKLGVFAGILFQRHYGLGKIEFLLADDHIEEIGINTHRHPLSVYHRKYGWMQTNQFLNSDSEIYAISETIGRKVGREITSLNPIMEAHLLTGDRVTSTLSPISTEGNTLTIRKFARKPWTVVQFISPEYKTLSPGIAALLWLAVQYELNIMVAGGTASGKTSVLNTLCAMFPPTHRVISIEDTRELSLPESLHWNWIPMLSRQANPEGMGELTMLDLMVAALRMRPDRLVVGEVRKQPQVEALFEAMHTGHAVYSTMHADTVEQVKRRLIEPPIQIPMSEMEALHLLLVQYRDRRRGLRRTLEVAEITRSSGEDVRLNYLYRWHPRTGSFRKTNEMTRLVEELNLHTGMTPQEIRNDLGTKESILNWMLKNNLTDLNSVGRVMSIYYLSPDTVVDAASKNMKADKLLGTSEDTGEK